MKIEVKPRHKQTKQARLKAVRNAESARLKEAMQKSGDENIPLPDEFLPMVNAPENDLDKIGATKDKALSLLAARNAIGKWRAALDLCACRWDMYTTARRRSNTYRQIADAIEESIKLKRAAILEDTLIDTATGEMQKREGYLPPDSKAAQLYLQGNIERYKPNQTQPPQQVVINLGGGLNLNSPSIDV